MTAPRPAKPTVYFIDRYCEGYQDLFPEVRSFESFKNLHLGILSRISHKPTQKWLRSLCLQGSWLIWQNNRLFYQGNRRKVDMAWLIDPL
jgi:SRSO17 transposase